MQAIYKLHKRSIVHIQRPDIEVRAIHCVRDAVGNAQLVVYNLLRDADLQPGDEMTVDVRILIEREVK
jgi:hypothetical protein